MLAIGYCLLSIGYFLLAIEERMPSISAVAILACLLYTATAPVWLPKSKHLMCLGLLLKQ
jgi:hypothetical protein